MTEAKQPQVETCGRRGGGGCAPAGDAGPTLFPPSPVVIVSELVDPEKAFFMFAWSDLRQ